MSPKLPWARQAHWWWGPTQRDDAREAVGCAAMILVRGEPSWEEMLLSAAQDTLVGKVRTRLRPQLIRSRPGASHHPTGSQRWK